MRAQEFVVENRSGVDLQVSKNADGVAIRALANGKLLGNAELFFDEQGRLDPQTLWVDDRYQSQGIAKAMYDHLKSLGYTVIRSWDQTDAGRGFWDKHRGAEVNVWETTSPDIHQRGFKHRQEIGDFLYTAKADNESGWGTQLIITVYDGKKEIAQTEFIMDEETDSLESANTWVLPDYQELGIASTMYAYAKMLGNDIVPSRIQTDQGNAMWRSWNQSKQSKHILPRGHKGYNEIK